MKFFIILLCLLSSTLYANGVGGEFSDWEKKYGKAAFVEKLGNETSYALWKIKGLIYAPMFSKGKCFAVAVAPEDKKVLLTSSEALMLLASLTSTLKPSSTSFEIKMSSAGIYIDLLELNVTSDDFPDKIRIKYKENTDEPPLK